MSLDTIAILWALFAVASVFVGMRYNRPIEDVLGAALLGALGLALLYHFGQKADRATASTAQAARQPQS